MARLWTAIFALVLSLSAQAESIKLITLNVENLFDWTHDAGKNDFTYLPLTIKRQSREVRAFCARQPDQYKDECFNLDWSEAVVRRKIQGLATFLNASFTGGPDVVFVQEVENMNVLSMLATTMGPKYRAVLIEGADERGIDVGIITRLPVTKFENRPILLPNGNGTRGVLRVDVTKAGQRIALLNNHWPSQGNPDADRITAANVVAEFANEAAREADVVIAAGDFNTAPDDVRDGIKEILLPLFWDAEAEARLSGTDLFAGTYNYRGVWQSLDRIFVMKNAKDFSWGKVKILFEGLLENRMFNNKPEQHPRRHNPKTGEGLSDHLPIKMELDL